MDKILSICLILLIVPFVVFAQPQSESVSDVKLAVMQGPTGFSSVGLDDFVTVQVLSSPDEAVAKLINKEIDMAVLPANSAAVLYNKGVDIKFVAIVGEGMLSVIGTDVNSTDIYVPGLGGTPDHMQRLLFPQYNAVYSVTAPAQVAQLLIAGKASLAILPQPFVNMVLNGNSSCKILSDVQEKWASKTGFEQYPMSVLVARGDFAKSNKKTVERVKEAYEKSIEWVLANTALAGAEIEKLGIMKAALATGAIDKCALVFKHGNSAKDELLAYYKVLVELAPEAIGGKLPEEDFWK